MKLLLKFLVLPLFVLSCATKPTPPRPSGGNLQQYRGKVLFDMCGNIAIQFTDGTLRGQMGWRRDGDSTVYNNVFRVSNPCTWRWDGRNNDITFTFAPPEPQQCMQCMAWTATPDSAFAIHVLK